MKIALVDKGKYTSYSIKKELEGSNFNIVKKNPELVISHGGDGTFLIAERKYPGIPKLLIRDSKVCFLCVNKSKDKIFEYVNNKKYKLEECIKFKVRNLLGVNDVIIRNKKLTEGLRFNLKINNKDHGDYIGDGLVIATPFGSTGYFHSITRKKCSKGNIGIAFNNTTSFNRFLIVKDNAKIEVKILRGIAQLAVDNNPKVLSIKPNGKIKIEKTKEKARIIKIPMFK